MKKISTKTKLRVDNKILHSVLEADDEGYLYFDCEIEWGIEDHNSEIQVFLYDAPAFILFAQLKLALLKYKGNFKDIFIFSEIENKQIDSIFVDELAVQNKRSLGNRDKPEAHAYFNFNYLEIHWKDNPPHINREAQLFFNSAANYLFDKEFYTFTAETKKEDLTSLEVKMESSYKSTHFPIGGYDVLPAINFYFPKLNEEEIVIKKEPFLSVRLKEWEQNSLQNLIQYSDILTRLLSAYSNRHIEFLKLNVFYNEISLEIIRSIPFNYDYNAKNSLTYIVNLSPPETFLSAFDYKILNERFEILNRLVNTKLLAYNSTGITKFMMFFIIVDSVKELTSTEDENIGINFSFNSEESEAKFESVIEDFFNKMKELLDESELKAFNSKKYSVKKGILIRNMRDQFNNFFALKKIEVKKDYHFDFERAKEIRNDIFHGRELTEDKKTEMEEICQPNRLPKLADDLLFGFFGAKPENTRNRQSK